MPTTVVQIAGIHCPSCAAIIKDVSSEFPQIQKVYVNVDTKNITIEHGDDFNFAKWKQEIESLGDSYRITSSEI